MLGVESLATGQRPMRVRDHFPIHPRLPSTHPLHKGSGKGIGAAYDPVLIAPFLRCLDLRSVEMIDAAWWAEARDMPH